MTVIKKAERPALRLWQWFGKQFEEILTEVGEEPGRQEEAWPDLPHDTKASYSAGAAAIEAYIKAVDERIKEIPTQYGSPQWSHGRDTMRDDALRAVQAVKEEMLGGIDWRNV